MKLTKERLEEIRARCEAATVIYKGPTHVDNEASGQKSYVFRLDHMGWEVAIFNDPDNHRNDAVFFVEAHTDIPDLLSHIAALSAERDAAFRAGAEAEREKARLWIQRIRGNGMISTAWEDCEMALADLPLPDPKEAK
jgi:hypothetical protein